LRHAFGFCANKCAYWSFTAVGCHGREDATMNLNGMRFCRAAWEDFFLLVLRCVVMQSLWRWNWNTRKHEVETVESLRKRRVSHQSSFHLLT
jgi:hypothetical protein